MREQPEHVIEQQRRDEVANEERHRAFEKSQEKLEANMQTGNRADRIKSPRRVVPSQYR